MTTRFRVADRVRATRRNRGWLGTSGGTVTAVEPSDAIYPERVTVSWDSGKVTDSWADDIERIGIR